MQGEKKFEPKLYYDVNLLDFIGQDHFLVRLDRVVSLEWIRARTKSYYSHTGKPSIDPVVLVKMLLVSVKSTLPCQLFGTLICHLSGNNALLYGPRAGERREP